MKQHDSSAKTVLSSLDAKELPYTVSIVYPVIAKLDLTSFNNSIGPRREKGKHTFEDYGFALSQSDEKKAVVREPDGSWEFVVTLLPGTESIKICLEDKALNGGSYHTQHAYMLAPAKDGLLQASLTEDPACPSFNK